MDAVQSKGILNQIRSLRRKMTVISNDMLGCIPDTHDMSCVLWRDVTVQVEFGL